MHEWETRALAAQGRARPERRDASRRGAVCGPPGRLGLAVLAAALLALALRSAPAAATPVLLQDGSALLTVDPDSPLGLTDWTLAGVQHVRRQGFWLRPAGAGGESPLADLEETTPPVTADLDADGDADALAVSLGDPGGRFDVDLRWSLAGSPLAPVTAGAASTLGLSLTLRNLTGEALALELFQLTDVDLLGSFADDDILFSGSPPNTATVTDASGLAVYEAVFTAPPDAVEAATFGGLLPRLEDGAPTVLDGSLAAGGDVTAAVGWSLSLPAGGSFLLSQSQRIEVEGLQIVPEPAVLWLAAGALAILARGRRGNGAHPPRSHPPQPGRSRP